MAPQSSRVGAGNVPRVTIKDILMPLQPIPPAVVEPGASGLRWKLIESEDGFTHLVGSDAMRTGGVVSYRSAQAGTSLLIIFGRCHVIY